MTAPPSARPGRNDPCHCGSGRKYKRCCLAKDEAADVLAAAASAKVDANAAANAAASDDTVTAPPRSPKHQTNQPWKTNSRGFVPRTRTPRKVGGA